MFMRLHLLLVTVCSGLIRFVPFLIVRLMRLMIIAAIWVVTRHVGILGRPAVLLSSIRVSGCHECWNKSEGNEVKIEHSRSWRHYATGSVSLLSAAKAMLAMTLVSAPLLLPRK